MPSRLRLLLSLAAGLIAAVVVMQHMPEPLPELSRADFLAEARAGHLRSVVIRDQDVILGESSSRGAFRSRFGKDEDAALPAELRALGIEVRFERSPLGLI